MEFIETEITTGESFKIGYQISLSLDSGIPIETLTQFSGMAKKTVTEINGVINAIEDKNFFIKTQDGTIIKIDLDTLSLSAIISENADLKNLCAAYHKLLIDQFDPNSTPSKLGNRAQDVVANQFKYKDSARMLTMFYSPTVYKALYIGNPEGKTKQREIFEDTFIDITETVLGIDGLGKLFEYLEPTLFELSKQMELGFDAETKEALNLLKIYTIELASYIKEEKINKDLVLGSKVFTVTRPIPSKLIADKSSEYSNSNVLVDGMIIDIDDRVISISTKEGILQINTLAYLLGCMDKLNIGLSDIYQNADLITKIFDPYMEDLNPRLLLDIIEGYISDNYLVAKDELLETFFFFESLVKTGYSQQLIDFIKILKASSKSKES